MFFVHRNRLILELIHAMTDLTTVISQLSTDVTANTAAVNAAVAVLKNPPATVTPEQLAALEAVATQMEANTKSLTDAMPPAA